VGQIYIYIIFNIKKVTERVTEVAGNLGPVSEIKTKLNQVKLVDDRITGHRTIYLSDIV
jgi:hypothetical protein